MSVILAPETPAPPLAELFSAVREGRGGAEAHCCAYRWLPSGRVRAQVLLVHGLGEHAGRHQTLIGALVQAGYAVLAYDQYGHGHSPGVRGYIRRFDETLEDFAAFLAWSRRISDGSPRFLLGHSLGGLIVTSQAMRAPLDVSGVVLSSPFVAVPESVSPILVAASRLLSSVAPRLIVHRPAPAHISRDTEAVRAYTEDPLVYRGGVRARTGAEIHRALRRVDFSAFDAPLLVLHGQEDHIAPIAGSRRLYSEAGSACKEFRVYPGAYHELFHDICAEEVTRVLLAWLAARE